MTRQLQLAADQKLKVLLYKLTSNRFSGTAIGSLLGLLIHSAATIVMSVSFINAGLMSLEQSMGVMLGANIGTTLSMQAVSFHIEQYCYVAIFIGFLTHLVLKGGPFKHGGLVLFGFGLLYLGLSTMSEGVAPLKNSGLIEVILRNTSATTLGGMLTGLLFSTVFTALIQSSGATIGILFAMCSAGIFQTFDQIFPLVLGSHIGTCITPVLGSIGTHIHAKRAAIAHVVFNVIGAILALLMYRFYRHAVPFVDGRLIRQIANTHTMVQVINTLLFLPFINQYTRFILKITPSKEGIPEKTYLDDKLLDTPEQAIVAALLELKRMSTVARQMFQETMRGFLDVDKKKYYPVKKKEEAIDALKDAIAAFLLALAERKLSSRQSIIIQYLMTAVNDLERIGDHIDNIAELTREKMEKGIWFEDDSVLDLIELYKKADGIMALIVNSFEPSFYESPVQLSTQILELRNAYVSTSELIRQKHNKRILEKKEDALSGIFFYRYITCFNKLVKHSKTIAIVEKEPFFFVKKHKLELKSEKQEREENKTQKVDYDSSIFE